MSDDIGPVEDLGWIPIEQIRFNSYNPNVMSEVDFLGLVENIKALGFRGAVLLRPGESAWECVDGEHRIRAIAEVWALPRDQMPAWVEDHMIGKVNAIGQKLDDAHAQLSTLSMNVLRGQHDPIAEAKVLVQVAQQIGDAKTLTLLGMRQVEFDTSVALLAPPEAPPIASTGDQDTPVNITITLLSGQAMSYEQAMEKALLAMPEDDSLVLVKERADAYDEAMRKAIRIGNLQKRGDAFWQICQWFLEATDDALRERFPPKQREKKKQ